MIALVRAAHRVAPGRQAHDGEASASVGDDAFGAIDERHDGVCERKPGLHVDNAAVDFRAGRTRGQRTEDQDERTEQRLRANGAQAKRKHEVPLGI